MGPITSGIVYGVICAAIVWGIGFRFVSHDTYRGSWGDMFAEAFRWLLRGALGVATAVAVGLALVFISQGASWSLFWAWLITYGVGVVAYFVTRYAPHPKH